MTEPARPAANEPPDAAKMSVGNVPDIHGFGVSIKCIGQNLPEWAMRPNEPVQCSVEIVIVGASQARVAKKICLPERGDKLQIVITGIEQGQSERPLKFASDLIVTASDADIADVAESLARLAAGHLWIGVDLGDALSIASEGLGGPSHGRGVVFAGLLNQVMTSHIAQEVRTLETLGFGGGMFGIQLIQEAEECSFELGALDQAWVALTGEFQERSSLLTAAPNSTTSAFVLIRFKANPNRSVCMCGVSSYE